jgi:hypothetical protein
MKNFVFELNKFQNIEPNKGKFKKMWFFLKFLISVRGGYCDDSFRAPQILAMPLDTSTYLST